MIYYPFFIFIYLLFAQSNPIEIYKRDETCIGNLVSIPECYSFLLNSYRRYPFRTIEASLNISSLERPFQFELPALLPVIVGNSGQALSTITLGGQITVVQSVSSQGGTSSQLTCQYKGSGLVPNPQLPNEIASAKSYRFLSCSPLPLQAGDILRVDNTAGAFLKAAVIDGGNQASLSVVEIRFWLNETETDCGNPNNAPQFSCVPTILSSTIYDDRQSYSSATVTNTNIQDPAQMASNGANSVVTYAIIGVVALFAVSALLISLFILRQRKTRLAYFNSKGIQQSDNIFFSKEDVRKSSDLNKEDEQDDFEKPYSDDHVRNIDFERRRAYSADNLKSALEKPVSSMKTKQLDRAASIPLNKFVELEPTLMNTHSGLSMPGFLLLQYNNDLRLEKAIAEGGSGIIYEAELLDDNLRRKYRVRKVAVKVMKGVESISEEERDLHLRHEVSIMWSLAFNKNIIKIIGFCESPRCIITKLYHQNLGDVILDTEHFNLYPELVASFAADISCGMSEMHSLGIAHRDLKSSNCLIEKLDTQPFTSYNIVICDFGLSRVDASIASTIKAWRQCCVEGLSVRYAAPEVFIRMHLAETRKRLSITTSLKDVQYSSNSLPSNSVEEDKPADVFAFAIVLWELLERKIPWDGLSNDEIEFHVRQGERPLLTTFPQTNSDDLNFIGNPGHVRQSTARTTASSIITSFKRYTFNNRSKKDFDVDIHVRKSLTSIIEIAWQTEAHVRPKFCELKAQLVRLLDSIKRNASA